MLICNSMTQKGVYHIMITGISSQRPTENNNKTKKTVLTVSPFDLPCKSFPNEREGKKSSDETPGELKELMRANLCIIINSDW